MGSNPGNLLKSFLLYRHAAAAFYSAAVLPVLPLVAALSVAFLRDPYGALGLWVTQKSAVCILFHAEKVFLILETVFCVYYYVHNGNRKFYHGRFKDNLLLETIVSIPIM